jgi:hypothetical protein
MSLNGIGLVAALATFLGVWLGHVTVRKIEFISPTVWLPSILAVLLGVILEIGALVSANIYLSAALGILGITVLWDALEFWRQHRRVEKGHAPANRGNPRHRRLLAQSSSATTLDYLAWDPAGRQLSIEERLEIVEANA